MSTGGSAGPAVPDGGAGLEGQPPAGGPATPVATRPPRGRGAAGRRGLLGRLSLGHALVLAAGLLAAVLNYAVLTGLDERVPVLVAGRDLEAGEPVDAAALATGRVRADGELLGALVEAGAAEDVEGWATTTAVPAGAPLRRSDLRPPGAPGGERAMSLPIEPGQAVGGALRVGDRVDVIVVRGDGAAYLTSGAEVLAVDGGDAAGLGSLRSFSVTLAVDDAVALRLALALHHDELALVRATGAPAPETRVHPRAPAETDAPSAPAAPEAVGGGLEGGEEA